MKLLKKNIKFIIIILLIIVLCVFKQGLVRNLPILANAGAVEDDELMVEHAKTLLERKWLGNYSYNTLIKNPFFSMFLALCKLFSISYLNATTILYSLACIIFMLAIRKNIKNNICFILIFALLLFNPVMFSKSLFQRVYRNSIIPSLSLLVIGSYIAMFFCRDNKIVFFGIWSIIASISFATFYYTREDSIWLVPFLVFMSISIVTALIITLIKNKEYNYKNIILITSKILFLILPIITTSIFGSFILSKNRSYYNANFINKQSNSSFSELVNTINSIKPNIEIAYVTNTREKLERMSEVSPSFAKIKPELDNLIEFFKDPETNEVINGLFIWPFISAVSKSGYDTYEKENELFIRMNKELNDAINDGKLERQKLMPIVGGEALTPNDYKRYCLAIIEATKFISDYNNITVAGTPVSPYYQGLYDYMSKFKEITGNRVILDENAIDLNGNKMPELEDQKEYISSLENQISILNNIKNIYTYLAKVLQFLGVISYIVITVIMVMELFKKKYDLIEKWIVESAILGAIFTLVLGICYTHIALTKAITVLYLGAAYPLFIIFSCICIYNLIEKIISIINSKKKEQK